LFDITGQPICQPLKGHTQPVWSVTFSPNGKILASSSRDTTIFLWDVVSGQPLGGPLNVHYDDVDSVVFSPDGKMLASGSFDDSILFWDVTTWLPLGQPLGSSPVEQNPGLYKQLVGNDNLTLISSLLCPIMIVASFLL
jgi:WD40 repeat protein